MEEAKKSEGKFLGRVAFWVSEVLVIIGAISILISSFSDTTIDVSFSEILLLQGTIFTVTWAAKSTKNYIDMKGIKNDTSVSNSNSDNIS
jgi:hypothetical protein